MMTRCVWLLSIMILLSGVVGCTAVSSPTPTTTPTPAPPTERPLPTPSATAIPLLEKTAVASPTPSPAPPAPTIPSTPTPSFILPPDAADLPITNVILSSQDQLAYIRGETLYVETAPRSEEFEVFGRAALAAAWSPDGSQLAYSIERAPSAGLDDANQVYDLRLWSPSDLTDVSLCDIITDFPVPAPQVNELYWTPDGSKILVHTSFTQEESEEHNYMYDGELTAVDLNLKTWKGSQLVSSRQQVVWLTDEIYIVGSHCGSPCADISGYDYFGNLIWEPYWTTGGFVDFAPQGNFMINVGRIDTNLTDGVPTEPYLPTLDKIDLTTGDIEVVWGLPTREDYFTPFIMPSISPDEKLFSFNFGGGLDSPGTLYVVNQDGSELGRYENSFLMDWRQNGDFIFNTIPETGDSQLQLASPDGSLHPVFTATQGLKIAGGVMTPSSGGRWSLDGQFFVFILKDPFHRRSQIHLWSPGDADLQLIHYVGRDSEFQSPVWLSDSTGFYFTSGKSSVRHEAVWFYDIESKELKLIAPKTN